MGEEIGFENGRISEFQGLVTLTLSLDRVILHTVMHQSSTSTYIPNFIEIEETFCRRMGGRTFETHFIRSNWRRKWGGLGQLGVMQGQMKIVQWERIPFNRMHTSSY